MTGLRGARTGRVAAIFSEKSDGVSTAAADCTSRHASPTTAAVLFIGGMGGAPRSGLQTAASGAGSRVGGSSAVSAEAASASVMSRPECGDRTPARGAASAFCAGSTDSMRVLSETLAEQTAWIAGAPASAASAGGWVGGGWVG
eukprot:scaffold31609_cov90-Isochrysis_galbana.AAC.1